jgi:hypothetical protein
VVIEEGQRVTTAMGKREVTLKVHLPEDVR